MEKENREKDVMMQIVVAPDSFKGSIDARTAAAIVKAAIKEADAHYHVIEKPMADGGEGTIDVLITSMGGHMQSVNCTHGTGKEEQAFYAICEGNRAVIESAEIIGLADIPVDQRHPGRMTSYGLGQAMLHAMDTGCTELQLTLGGSATNDGGLGMLLALGMQAWDKQGNPIGIFGRHLLEVERLDISGLAPRLKQISIVAACDVTNPLCGNDGATSVYGPQKGLAAAELPAYDAAMAHVANLLEKQLNKSLQQTPGAGAAGGLGFALLVLGAELVPGAALVAEAIDLETAIQTADLVITGEGKSDDQTQLGKAPGHVAKLAQKHQVPTILLSGKLGRGWNEPERLFIAGYETAPANMPIELAIKQAKELLKERTKQIMQEIHIIIK